MSQYPLIKSFRYIQFDELKKFKEVNNSIIHYCVVYECEDQKKSPLYLKRKAKEMGTFIYNLGLRCKGFFENIWQSFEKERITS